MLARTADTPTLVPAGPADLLRRAAAGHPDAWAALVTRYTPLLQARVRRYRLQDADAHDVIQVTWLRLSEHVDRIHTPDHLAGWLAAVVSRECLRVLREAARAVPLEDVGVAVAEKGAGPEQLAVARLTRARQREAVSAALATLDPRRRALLLALFADDGRTYARIARDAGVPVGSLGPTRARVLGQLRRVLERSGADLAADLSA
jgi:RNA polymerase sigma factor (sigma-70 family)